MATKQQILEIVDELKDQSVLDQVYEILNYINVSKDDKIWGNLSLIKKEKVYESFEQSLDESKLLSHEQAMVRLNRWI
jgi:hypothetical protein